MEGLVEAIRSKPVIITLSILAIMMIAVFGNGINSTDPGIEKIKEQPQTFEFTKNSTESLPSVEEVLTKSKQKHLTSLTLKERYNSMPLLEQRQVMINHVLEQQGLVEGISLILEIQYTEKQLTHPETKLSWYSYPDPTIKDGIYRVNFDVKTIYSNEYFEFLVNIDTEEVFASNENAEAVLKSI